MHIGDHAIRAAQSPALIIADGRTISYGELYTRSQRVAALLYEAGLRRGDGVAPVLPNRPEFLEITWGCQLSGLYYSAVNTACISRRRRCITRQGSTTRWRLSASARPRS